MTTAKLTLDGKDYEFPVIVGSEKEVGIDISTLRAKSGAVTFDPGYGNTSACESEITFIDGDQGILRYCGYPIEQLATQASFIEVCYLLLNKRLPSKPELDQFQRELSEHTQLPEEMQKIFDGFTQDTHPMAMLASMVVSLSGFYPDSSEPEQVHLNIVRLLAKVSTLAAFIYKKKTHQPYVYPRNDLSYTGNFLSMMFGSPDQGYKVPDVLDRALNLLLILHADHEQNCSTSTVRMVGSSQANLFASISAGICALWGPLHGGANQEVVEMLQMIQADGGDYKKYVEMAKDKTANFRLMGFGHRVYKNFDPRAQILKTATDEVLKSLGINDPLLDIAKNLEEVALKDPFFVERKLYPNVDFYSGIIYRALGIPNEMFTVMFALGRMPGWISQWKEMRGDKATRINRPRQIYTGATEHEFTPISKR